MLIKGLELDSAGRCLHYHTDLDIVALQCQICQAFYACYLCHDALEEHPFEPHDIDNTKPIFCGNCKTYLSFEDYHQGSCPSCQHRFNPNCKKHYSIYFKGVKNEP
ncbi:CHY zinc finger protein [Streptococcus plurextorum]|uniref:CHY zinc finger protein n=1 Tax=Streptococcus plurextorum TaxID=456876 RepID=UPI0003FA6FFF|nr:CHY zinc finger protein [Streptococcus plurextorum]